MTTYYDSIYLAPHLDDVALSCGGQIYEQTQAGQRVLVVTITAGDPPAQVSGYAASLHTRWQLAVDAAREATAARRAEDLAACAILGAAALHWALPDCIYRTHPATNLPFYVSDADIFGAVAPAEEYLIDDLAQQITELPPHGQLVAPLTVGHHVDHQLTRLAAEQAVGPAALLYYEDYPYAQQPGSLAQVLGNPPQGWRPLVNPLSAAALAAKFEAVVAFRSQVSTFFAGRADLEAQIRAFAAQTGGERLWRWTGME